MSQEVGLERFLSFSLGKEEYAIPLLTVKEVIAIPEITPIPQSPPYFLGIMNLRGQVISIIDLRQKFGIKTQNTEETSVIILDLEDHSLGVVVDSVNAVLNPAASELSEPPDLDQTKNSESITKVYRKDQHMILILDVAKTLSKTDRAVVAPRPKAA